MKNARARGAGQDADQNTQGSNSPPPPAAQVYIPPLAGYGSRYAADVVIDRCALHIRARIPGCGHLTLNEITALLCGLHAEVAQLLTEYGYDEEAQS